jgi:pimeloyl-ACP methyl ester carboxylesterase
MRGVGALCALVIVVAGCASSSTTSSDRVTSSLGPTPSGAGTQATDRAQDPATTQDCIVRLHGKGGSGQPSQDVDGVVEVSPDGNDDGWGARQWLYFPADRYDEARRIVEVALDDEGCDRAIVDGFSNGAAFAASLLCRGENFDNRVIGYIVDDPVPDRAVEGCAAPDGMNAVVYWTGGLDGSATPGADCASIDWTCDGGTMIGIEAYAEAIGVSVTASPFTDHQWHRDAPELTEWFG